VTARDSATGYPTRAYLTVGYGPLSETFLSKVECSEADWAVSARSGERAFRGQPDEDKHAAGLFEYLDTIWKLEPLEGSQQQHLTKVQLAINFKFRSAMHAAMMSAVEDQVAEAMVDAFEKRFKAVYGTR
jgi:coenzyme Q-binding protein COQ10